jgi:radical SAM protein with 4Fe4S-binding SPASM domain
VDTWAGFGDQSVSLNQIQQVRLRLLSLNSEKHDKYICEKGNHRRTLAFIERLAKDFSGEKILVFPICRENMGEIHSILSWCQDYNFRLNMFIVSRQHKYALKHYEYLEVIRELCALPLQDIIIDTPLLGLHGWPNLCSGGRLAMFIDIDGGIKPCPYFPYPLFHIEEGLSKAWRNLQREIINLNVNCTSCSYFSSCGGGCLANKSNTGKEYYCPHNEAEEQLRK